MGAITTVVRRPLHRLTLQEVVALPQREGQHLPLPMEERWVVFHLLVLLVLLPQRESH